MRLVISREESTDEGTFSTGVLDGDLAWDFVELPWKDNLQGLSCIPAGEYEARLIQSPHFGRAVYVLEDVPGRSAIEMHPANWGGDVELGYYSDLRGCCAPGTDRALLVTPDGKLQRGVTHSKLALDQLMEAAGSTLTIKFTWIGQP